MQKAYKINKKRAKPNSYGVIIKWTFLFLNFLIYIKNILWHLFLFFNFFVHYFGCSMSIGIIVFSIYGCCYSSKELLSLKDYKI